ncbi:MAG: hypothetical protein ABR524_14215 [Thermoanaerobaculia bacterium]
MQRTPEIGERNQIRRLLVPRRMMLAAALILLTAGLAAANGANDVSKGIATLVGSGVSDYPQAGWSSPRGPVFRSRRPTHWQERSSAPRPSRSAPAACSGARRR